jgi:high-affinity iron transporter
VVGIARQLGYLAPLLNARQPGLVATAMSQLDTLQRALLATRDGDTWQSPGTASPAARERVDGSTGALLETLASVPDLLELPPAH